MKIYFDNVLIDADNYVGLTKSGKVYDGVFKLGATICETYKLKVNKGAVSSIPDVVELKDNSNNIIKTLYVADYNDNDDYYISFNLEDAMTKFNFRYDASQIFVGGETTLGAIFEDICAKANVDTDITTFYKSDMVVNWYDNTYMARDYLSYIAEINGKNFRISANDKLEFVNINTTPVTDIDFDDISKYKLGVQHTITRVVLGDWQFGNTDGETYYINEDNVYATSEAIVRHIYDEIKDFTYYNFKTDNCPLEGLNTGDLVSFTYGEDTYNTFVQFNEANYSGNNWFGGIEVNLDSPVKQETQVVGEEDRYRRIKRIVDQQNGTIVQIVEEQNEQGERMTTIEQTLDQIETQIQDIPTITTENSGTGNVYLSNLLNTRLIELKIHPTDKDIIGLFASTQLKVALGLKTLSRGITFDGDEDYYYMIPDNLYYVGETYDEFIYDGKNQKIQIIHRIGINENDEKYILEEPIIEDYDYYDIIIGDGNYNVFLQTYPTAYIYIKGMIKNDYTTNFATSYELDTKITQTNNQIQLLAEEKVDENEIIAKLNLAVENGQGIVNLVGNTVTIQSDNFELDEEGNVKMSSAEIDNGKLKLYDAGVQTVWPEFSIESGPTGWPSDMQEEPAVADALLRIWSNAINIQSKYFDRGYCSFGLRSGYPYMYLVFESYHLSAGPTEITIRNGSTGATTQILAGSITLIDGNGNRKTITPTS